MFAPLFKFITGAALAIVAIVGYLFSGVTPPPQPAPKPSTTTSTTAVTPPPTTTGNSLATQMVLIWAASSVLPEPSLPPTEASGLVVETCRGPAPM